MEVIDRFKEQELRRIQGIWEDSPPGMYIVKEDRRVWTRLLDTLVSVFYLFIYLFIVLFFRQTREVGNGEVWNKQNRKEQHGDRCFVARD